MSFSLFHWYLQLTGYPLSRARKELKAIQLKSIDERKVWVKEKQNEILNYHFENNQFYRKKLNNKLPLNWNEVPALYKSDLQTGLESLLSKPFTKGEVYISNTSGSSGTPFFYAKDKFSHAMTWALIESRYAEYGIALNDLQARFYGIPLTGFSGFKERMKDRIMNRVRFPVFDLSDTALDKFLEVFARKKFKYVYGYTNSIVLFCRYLMRKEIILNTLCPSIRCVMVTSEMCTPDDKLLIEKATGVPCVIEYGASEFGIISYQKPNGFQKISEELVLVETNSKEEILITSLFNKAFPFIKYNIADRGKLIKNELNELGISELMGRSDDTILLPDGRQAAGLTMYYCSRKILESFTSIKEIYFTQTKLDAFTIYYISEIELSKAQLKIISDAFETYLCAGLQLTFEKTDKIRRKQNGKFQLFTSLIINKD